MLLPRLIFSHKLTCVDIHVGRHGLDMVSTRCRQGRHGLDTVSTRCRQGRHGLDTVSTRCRQGRHGLDMVSTRCRHGVDTVGPKRVPGGVIGISKVAAGTAIEVFSQNYLPSRPGKRVAGCAAPFAAPASLLQRTRFLGCAHCIILNLITNIIIAS